MPIHSASDHGYQSASACIACGSYLPNCCDGQYPVGMAVIYRGHTYKALTDQIGEVVTSRVGGRLAHRWNTVRFENGEVYDLENRNLYPAKRVPRPMTDGEERAHERRSMGFTL